MRLLPLFAAGLLAATAAPASERPNILLIVSDDHRADLLSCEGHPIVHTPNIDRLAEEGIRFARAYATSGVCSPSRATILTGRYAFRASAPKILWENNSFLTQVRTLPHILQEEGYNTAHFGKWHLGGEMVHQPGYDHWVSFPFVSAGHDTTLYINGVAKPTEGFTDFIVARMAADYIAEAAQGDRPFHIHLWLNAPHLPYPYPAEDAHLFRDEFIPKPPTFDLGPSATGRHSAFEEVLISAEGFHAAIPSFGSWENMVQAYYRSARTIDDSVGIVVRALEEAGVLDNTIVIYTSDQGYSMGEHGLIEKHFAYEPPSRIPMIIRHPGIVPAGQVVDRLVMTNDIAPTLADYAGVPAPPEHDGASWRTLFEAEDPAAADWRDEFMFDQWSPGVGIPGQNALRTDRFKLITFPYLPGDFKELYDLENDPLEMRNVFQDPMYAEIAADMVARLEAYRERIGWSHREVFPVSELLMLGPLDPEAAAHARARIEASGGALPEDLDWTQPPMELETQFAAIDAGTKDGADDARTIFVATRMLRTVPWDAAAEAMISPNIPFRGWVNGSRIADWPAGPPNWAFRFNPPIEPDGSLVIVEVSLPAEGPVRYGYDFQIGGIEFAAP